MLVIAAASFITGTRRAQKAEISILIGERILAPEPITAPLSLGTIYDESGNVWQPAWPADKPILLHFWASWCPTCRRELRDLSALASIMQNELQVITVSVDSNPMALMAFLQEDPQVLPVLRDPDGSYAKISAENGLPVTYLLDINGNLCYRFNGAKAWTAPHAVARLEEMLHKDKP